MRGESVCGVCVNVNSDAIYSPPSPTFLRVHGLADPRGDIGVLADRP